MRLFRCLALVLVCFGLVIQDPAYAAASPTAQAAASVECAEMTTHERAPLQEHKKGCCDDMRSCVLGMNCMAPLAVPEATGHAAASLAGADALYGSLDTAALSAAARGPEPPPPQL
jgi:hypothetical protein